MTEHEAWLALARMFEPGPRMPLAVSLIPGAYTGGERVSGLCLGTERLEALGDIDSLTRFTMDDRIEIFNPDMGDAWFWGEGGARKERATACGLLAAMTNGTP